jgi:hypothetical protein
MSTTILDPVAQTFIIDETNFPRGVFLSSIRLFFREKPTTQIPVQVSIVSTLNGYPTGKTLDYSIVTLFPNEVEVSQQPQYLDSSTYTEFTFAAPVYINSGDLYAIIVQSNSSGYKLWAAAQNDFPVASSVKETPTSATPTTLSKISKSPYVGSFFESQNGITYTADQTKDLMFTINRCVFNTSANPTISYVVPQGLPESKNVEDTYTKATANVVYDELNLSTTQFVPSGTNVGYTYQSVLNNTGALDAAKEVSPGEFGTPLPTNLFLNDNKGERVLNANSNTSFYLNATLSTTDNILSPILADDGMRLYTVKYSINNMGLSNSVISVTNSGIGYLSNTSGTLSSPDITVSAPSEPGGAQAYVSANVQSGNIVSVYVTTEGSGYTTTPTITVSALANTTSTVAVSGETSPDGGNGLARYLTYPVTLAQGNDSGDLRVFFTAYRPTNTNIHVYYKILSREDTQTFEQGSWQKMTLVGAGSNKFSSSRADLFEYEAAPGSVGVADNSITYTSADTGLVYNNFYKYAIKIVLSSADATFTPFLRDMRVIALPEGSGI